MRWGDAGFQPTTICTPTHFRDTTEEDLDKVAALYRD